MTNKTINGVPRAVLSDVFDELPDWSTPAATKLSALLATPDPIVLCRGCFTEQPSGKACETCAKVESDRTDPVVETDGIGEPDDDYDRVEKVIDYILDGRQLTAVAKLRAILEEWTSDPQPLMVKFSDHKKGLDAYLEQITALQSTIAQLKADNDEPGWHQMMTSLEDQNTELRAENERLRGGLKLPARADAMTGSRDCQSGWNMCLDEVRRMNT